LSIAIAGTIANSAYAQSNYRLSPVGGRTTLVGGTGLVYGRDGASAFLNPATAVRVDDSRLSFSVNFYTMSFVYAPSWYRPGNVDRARFGDVAVEDTTMTDLEFNALPSSLCLFFKMGDFPGLNLKPKEIRQREARLGLCFATIHGQTFNFAAESRDHASAGAITRQAQTLSQSFNRFAFGPTYAMYITENLALGASIHGSLASHRSLLAATVSSHGSLRPPIASTFYGGARGDSFQVNATAGITYRLGRQTFALAVETPSLHVFGVGSANQHTQVEQAGSSSTTTALSGSFVSRSPLRVALGTGIESTWGSAELNVSFHAPLSRAYRAELTGSTVRMDGTTVQDDATSVDLAEPARGVVNIGVGTQVFVFPKVSLLAGLGTDVSAVQDGNLRGTQMRYFPYRTNRIAGSFGIGSHGEGGDILVGTEASYGWGQRVAVNSFEVPPTVESTGHSTFALLFVIAGSTSLKAIARAVKDVKEVVTEPGEAKKKPPEHVPQVGPGTPPPRKPPLEEPGPKLPVRPPF
jgi:hypothetical protein